MEFKMLRHHVAMILMYVVGFCVALWIGEKFPLVNNQQYCQFSVTIGVVMGIMYIPLTSLVVHAIMIGVYVFVVDTSSVNSVTFGVLYCVVNVAVSGITVQLWRIFMIRPFSMWYTLACVVPMAIVHAIVQIVARVQFNHLPFEHIESVSVAIVVSECAVSVCMIVPLLIALHVRLGWSACALYACHFLMCVKAMSDVWAMNIVNVLTVSIMSALVTWWMVSHDCDQLKSHGKDTTQSTFLSNMSHELRTPLNALLGSIQLLKTTRLGNEQSKYLDVCNNASEMMLSIINDILDYSKLEAGALETRSQKCDMHAILRQASGIVTQQARIKNVELVLDISLECPRRVVTDAKIVTQIVVNFLGNAMKFTDKGFVCLRAKHLDTFHFNTDHDASDFLKRQPTGFGGESPVQQRSKSWSRIVSKQQHSTTSDCCGPISYSRVLLVVEDTGIGFMDGIDFESLFHRFVQNDSSSTKSHEGTGLGLAITLRLAHLFHGQVGAKRNQYSGATFWCTLWMRNCPNSDDEVTRDTIIDEVSVDVVAPKIEIHALHHNRSMLSLLSSSLESSVASMNSVLAPGGYFSKQFVNKFVSDLLQRPALEESGLDTCHHIVLAHQSIIPISEFVQLPSRIRDFLWSRVIFFGCVDSDDTEESAFQAPQLGIPLEVSQIRNAVRNVSSNLVACTTPPKSKHLKTFVSAPAASYEWKKKKTADPLFARSMTTRTHSHSEKSRNATRPDTFQTVNSSQSSTTHSRNSSVSQQGNNSTSRTRPVCLDVMFHQSSRYISKVDTNEADNDTRLSPPGNNLPLVSAVEALNSSSSPPSPQAELTNSKQKILIVEDNKLNQTVVVSLLRRCGSFETTCVSDGVEAVAEYSRSVSNSACPKYAVVLCDCYMPNMDGFETARQIRELEKSLSIKSVPIIAFTASTTRDDHEKCFSSGMNAIVTKPVRLQTLISELNKYINPNGEEATSTTTMITTTKEQQGPIRVLYVEDNRMNQMVLCNMLRQSGGYETLTAADGLLGLQEYRKYVQTENRFDLLLLDCYMPNMDGFDTSVAIRDEEQRNGYQRVPIIAVTASTTKEDHEKCLSSGMDDIVTKPVRVKVLLETINRHLSISPRMINGSADAKGA